MTAPAYRVRRATVEDLSTLKALWSAMRYSADDLEKRLTDFQVAEDSNGKIIGGFAFTMHERHAWIHSEAFDDFSVADVVRPLFWKRISGLATNHGIARLWTQETSPFWSHNGFQAPAPEVFERLPETWRGERVPWLTLQLKDEQVIASLDKEITLLMETERRRTAEALERAKSFKTLITIIAFVIALLVIGAGIYLYFQRHRLPVVTE
ncbi:MAG TPA: hypothetical protein PKA41_10600 [Verrucomicrobiota bacterium]|nr:hypothetical protein [Verrucomicrobiota bacterium]